MTCINRGLMPTLFSLKQPKTLSTLEESCLYRVDYALLASRPLRVHSCTSRAFLILVRKHLIKFLLVVPLFTQS
jgi:hypothetical protein